MARPLAPPLGMAAAMAVSVVLPVAAWWIPTVVPVEALIAGWLSPAGDAGWLGELAATAGPADLERPVPAGSVLDGLTPALFGGWALGSIALLSLFLVSCRRLRIARQSWPEARVDGADVRISPSTGPAVIGIRRAEIVVPRWVLQLPTTERYLLLRHEQEHLRAGDSWLLAAAALALVLMPWNVPLWWQHRRLRDAVETDCDARVLARGADVRRYGTLLVQTAGRPAVFPFLSPSPALGSSPTLLKRRITTMTEKRPTRPLFRAAVLTGLAVATTLVACDATAPDAEAPTAPEAEIAAQRADEDGAPIIIENESGVGLAADSVRILVPSATSGAQAGGSAPIYYLDGERVDPSALDQLNPNEIERIEVLKGPQAVESAGPEAEHGVIRITTK